MKILLKYSLLLILLMAFLTLICYIWADDYLLQLIFIMLLTLVILLKFNLRQVITQYKLILPFVIIMLLVYLLIGIIGIKPIGKMAANLRPLSYWFYYGITRSLIFANTLLFLQLLLAFISLKDILGLPINIHKLKYLILGKALYEKSLNSFQELELHLLLIPEYQVRKHTLPMWFRMKLLLSFALIKMLLSESQKKGELIDNRIKHCFGK